MAYTPSFSGQQDDSYTPTFAKKKPDQAYQPTFSSLVPAIKKPDGSVVPGEKGKHHNDIPGITDKDQRGFVSGGKFLTRQQGTNEARAEGVKVPNNLHSENLIDAAKNIATGYVKGEGQFLGNLRSDIAQTSRQAIEDIKGDVTAPVRGKGGKAPGTKDYAARVGKIALDALNYASGGAAIEGAAKTIVGRPAENMIGPTFKAAGQTWNTKDTVADAAALLSVFIPFGSKSKGLQAVGKDVERVFSPTTVSGESRQAERTIRRATGAGNLEAEKAASQLVEHNKLTANMPVQAQREFISNLENGRPQRSPQLQAASDAIRKVYDGYRDRIQKILPKDKVPSFIDNYYVHMWREKPSIVGEKMSAYYRQGSGRSFKKRTFPTLEDGINAGLTPKTENPVEATMAYAQNMSRFLATHDIQQELRLQGYAKWFSPGSKHIPPGWVPLNGIMTEKAIAYRGAARGAQTGTAAQSAAPVARQIKLYAPPDVARVYNNFVSRGLEAGQAGGVFKAVRALANGTTMLKLGLSTFHLSTMANEGIISDVARGFQALSRGKVLTGAKAIAGAPLAPVRSYRRGLKMERELLDKKMPDRISAKVNDAFVRSGGQVRMDPFYRTRGAGSFFNAWEKGTLRSELKATADRLYRGGPFEKAKGTVDLAANIIQTTAAPLFEKYIPRIKRGAFSSRMEDWIRANPNASQREIDDAAIKIQDSVDNRFGELVQDNLFWHRAMKQMSQILLLSASWDLGTVREIAGGIKDIAPSARGIVEGKGITERTAYVAALASVVALENGVATYLKTGTMPHGADFIAYRTGGRDANSGAPERALTPGYQKDVIAFSYNFPYNVYQESVNKLNPALSESYQLLTNKDYRGLPIYRPEGVKPVPGEPTLFDYFVEQNMPISFSQFSKEKKGTNISTPERLMSIRPAPGYVQDPERQERLRDKYNTQDWKKRIRADQREKARELP